MCRDEVDGPVDPFGRRVGQRGQLAVRCPMRGEGRADQGPDPVRESVRCFDERAALGDNDLLVRQRPGDLAVRRFQFQVAAFTAIFSDSCAALSASTC